MSTCRTLGPGGGSGDGQDAVLAQERLGGQALEALKTYRGKKWNIYEAFLFSHTFLLALNADWGSGNTNAMPGELCACPTSVWPSTTHPPAAVSPAALPLEKPFSNSTPLATWHEVGVCRRRARLPIFPPFSSNLPEARIVPTHRWISARRPLAPSLGNASPARFYCPGHG